MPAAVAPHARHEEGLTRWGRVSPVDVGFALTALLFALGDGPPPGVEGCFADIVLAQNSRTVNSLRRHCRSSRRQSVFATVTMHP